MPVVKKSKATRSRAKAPGDAARHRVFGMLFARIYSAWLAKVERKGRTGTELDRVICWHTGYTPAALRKWVKGEADLGSFFDQAPAYNPASKLITGMICGVRVEEITEPSMRRMRELDKLIDELAKGRAMEKILRQ